MPGVPSMSGMSGVSGMSGMSGVTSMPGHDASREAMVTPPCLVLMRYARRHFDITISNGIVCVLTHTESATTLSQMFNGAFRFEARQLFCQIWVIMPFGRLSRHSGHRKNLCDSAANRERCAWRTFQILVNREGRLQPHNLFSGFTSAFAPIELPLRDCQHAPS